MLLAVDIGNSSIKFGIFDAGHLIKRSSVPTEYNFASDNSRLSLDLQVMPPISAAIACSVVPPIEEAAAKYLSEALRTELRFVKNSDDFGLTINYQPLEAAGTDRLVNSFAAVEKYGAPCIVCSFGTATTFDVVSKGRELLGGTIAPGMRTMLKALHLNAARLPDVELAKPANLLGKTTAAAIQSGVFYGQVAMAEGMIRRLRPGAADKPVVIATGGFASMIAANTDEIDLVDEDLTLDGLRLMHERIAKPSLDP